MVEAENFLPLCVLKTLGTTSYSFPSPPVETLHCNASTYAMPSPGIVFSLLRIMIKQHIQVATDIAVFTNNRGALHLLLVQRKNDPYKGSWTLPGGFLNDEEDLEAGARRELKEETGLSVEVLHQLRAFGAPGRDPRGHTITIVHYAILAGDPPAIKGSDDAADARWFPVDELPQLGFDHPQIVAAAIAKVKLPVSFP